MTREHSPAPLVPIPRAGIPGIPGTLLYLLVMLAAIIAPVGIASYFEGGTYLPKAAVEGLSVAGIILIGVYIARVVKTARGVLPILITGTLFAILSFRSVVPVAIILSLLFVTSQGALLLATADKRWLAFLPLIPLVSFALTVILCGHIHGGILSLLPFPAAVALAIGTRSSAAKPNGLTRVGVICVTALLTGLTLLVMGTYFLRLYLGTLDTTVLATEFEAFRTTLINLLTQKAAETGGTVAELMTSEYLANTINSLFNLLPGYLVAGICIYAALAQMLLLSGLHAAGFGPSITDRVRVYRISPVSDAVFILAYLVVIFTMAETSTMAGTVAHNLVIILQPGLALGGLLRLVTGLTRRGARGGCAPLFLLIIPVLLFIAPMILAGYEAIAGVTAPFRHRPQPPNDTAA